MKVYCAAKSKHAPWFRSLQAAGVPISATWIHWDGNRDGADEPTADQWSRHWGACIAQAAECDVCLFVSLSGETSCGALLEAGAALASGRCVYVVSPDKWTFAHHPRCRVFPNLESAIAAIMAMQAGEWSRQNRLVTDGRLDMAVI